MILPVRKKYLSVVSLNAGKYGPEKLRIPTLSMQCTLLQLKIFGIITLKD